MTSARAGSDCAESLFDKGNYVSHSGVQPPALYIDKPGLRLAVQRVLTSLLCWRYLLELFISCDCVTYLFKNVSFYK